jgi:hypothetical protein
MLAGLAFFILLSFLPWAFSNYKLTFSAVRADRSPSISKINFEDQLIELRKAVAVKPSEHSIDNLFPILVPSSFFSKGDWIGPHEILHDSEIGLTWTILYSGQTMVYLNEEIRAHWESLGLLWRKQALENLKKKTENVWTHEYKRDNGDLYAVAMMHEDGLGPSRLFADRILRDAFPDGYKIAVPEMSVGMAISNTIREDEMKKIAVVLQKCFQDGTRPLSGKIFEPILYDAKPA